MFLGAAGTLCARGLRSASAGSCVFRPEASLIPSAAPALVLRRALSGSIGYLVTRPFYGRSYESMTTSIPAGYPEEYAEYVAGVVATEVGE